MINSSLTSLDIHNLIKELSIIKKGRVNKIYQNQNKFTFKIHTTSKDYFFNIILPGLLFLSEEIKYSTITPGNLCMGLRKHLRNALITSIEQYKSERIIKITFQKSGIFTLIIEMFNRGNLVLLEEDKIVALYSTQNLKDRTIKQKLEYEMPVERCDFLNITKKDFLTLISNSKKPSIVLCLASEIGLGGRYSEEICFKAGIDKKEIPSKLISEKIYTAFKDLLKTAVKPNITGMSLFSYDLAIKDEKEKKFFKTFSLALEYLVKEIFPKRVNPKIDKLEHILEMQKESIKKLKGDIEKNKLIGEMIYENYPFIKEIYDLIEQYKTTKTINEILDTLLKHKKILKIDKKSRKITINV
jgi:predicted ribosome quality control (RQC) complex YloA/Tae2 family protein